MDAPTWFYALLSIGAGVVLALAAIAGVCFFIFGYMGLRDLLSGTEGADGK